MSPVWAARGAAVLAFGHAAISLYWVAGGTLLLDTVGGGIEEIARSGGAVAITLGVVAAIVKIGGGLLALALVAPWGKRLPDVLVLGGSAVASVILVLYGGVLVAAGALVLTGVLVPDGPVDRHALAWHVGVWDLWFLLWGISHAAALTGVWRVRVPAAPTRN